ncbi:MAG: UDP-N-acetylglucosamine/UDP-N-acetylgalactosamine diphosphorylase [Candidatus Paceibacteria bacterium]|jgi:UDP-N-acetylglucosamine/UDP-N-acetylgalactosamine diphosphorylase
MNEMEGRLREQASDNGQSHVFAFWDELGLSGRERLLTQLGSVDFELVAKQAALLGAPPANEGSKVDLAPPDMFPLVRDASQAASAKGAHAHGLERIAAGKIGFLLVAGGQASRLGYDGPKGTFPVGPVSGRSLFEIHARRLRAAQVRGGRRLDWYVMTSPANHEATQHFFQSNAYFGLQSDQVAFFSQAVIPALDLYGKILMSGKDSLFLAPNGHGGTLAAMQASGLLERAQASGIETLSYFQVDNPLVRPADPLFIGLHAAAEARMSSKVVSKRDAGEKVGVIGRADGRLGCIEYSDLPESLRSATDESGALLFGAGNIAAHLLQVDFIDELTRDGLELPWHVARKRMTVCGAGGQQESVDGAKFETFIFDALGKSPASVTLEVKREHEFSPVKNGEGEDSPRTACQSLCDLFGGWVQAAGRSLPQPDRDGVVRVEVDPLLAEDLETFVNGPIPEPLQSDRGHLYELDA